MMSGHCARLAMTSTEPPSATPVAADGEDTKDKIAERVKRVQRLIDEERRRVQCYAAAMSRRWQMPAEHFETMARGPREWPLKGRRYVYKTRSENDGVPTLTELCLNAIDAAYAEMGRLAGPEPSWLEAPVCMPTAYEQNGVLCRVVCKKQKVFITS
jgi:hypothetical protein